MPLFTKGGATAFLPLAAEREFTYLVSEFYTPAAERGVRWNDPAFRIEWPAEPAVISEKDCSWPDFVGERRLVATADQEETVMFILDRELKRLTQAGHPIKVGLVGC